LADGVRSRGLRVPPVEGTTHRSKLVADELRYAIRRPSGDQVGSPSPGRVVSRRLPVPSAFMTQIPA
jgi:hypothetical protein